MNILLNRLCTNTQKYAISSAHRDALASFLIEEPRPVICDKLKFIMSNQVERPPDTIWPSTPDDFKKLIDSGWPKLKAIHINKIDCYDKMVGIQLQFTNGIETPLIKAELQHPI